MSMRRQQLRQHACVELCRDGHEGSVQCWLNVLGILSHLTANQLRCYRLHPHLYAYDPGLPNDLKGCLGGCSCADTDG